MKKIILFIALLYSSFVIANECKIVSQELKYQQSKELTFNNRLLNKLSFDVPPPKQMLYGSDSPILIYDKNKYIGFQLIPESFGDKEKRAEQLFNKWEFPCNTPVIELITKDYQILIIDDEFKAANKIYKSVFFINDKKDYYYLIDFTGFTDSEIKRILSTIKQGE
ncbi:hypothetical protein [Entomomonas asaccharolytica]|uniref:Uncharacterized protein n=1 Tax=Entomomonas asaccharolytica TaxID=2785331 RepID=A0A974NGV1_9GAMM|nr:hypothetical protein [Entomomonas asaccharolytica]QQP86292.1 hypothetical protein JHT90_03345 [Entomomonas asaccharolytica]